MTFLRKLFAGRGNDAYQQGVTLYEQGHAAEAIPLLEPVFLQDPGSPRGSLAGLYLRQALVSEGRRLLAIGETDLGAATFGKAVAHWPEFPDLHFLTGAALGLTGQWGGALDAARQALRRNPEYCEARLLEASALQGLGREREANDSYQALLAGGRRGDHALLRELRGAEPPSATLPSDLSGYLRRSILGDDVKLRLAAAVSLCRAGSWQAGLAAFEQLRNECPRFPDVRARYAAVLYQAGDSETALEECEAALALNPRYRTAVCLRGLILAEHGEIQAAHDFLADAQPRFDGAAGRHEELFLAYLRACLCLLLGDLAACRRHLAGWHDLPRQFARAALLLAACDDLDGMPEAALRRLEELNGIWLADSELQFLRVALLLRQRQWAMAAPLLAQWPGGRRGLDDPRPLYLRARLELAQDREPVLPVGTAGEAGNGSTTAADGNRAADGVSPSAWRQLAISASLMRKEPLQAWALALVQLECGDADEETGRLLLRAAAQCGQDPPADLAARIGVADSWGGDWCRLLRNRGEGAQAESLVARRRRVRPDFLQWSWLSTAFWFDPVRRWLG
jgi:tetratricopeptide (TPR) repeat protein